MKLGEFHSFLLDEQKIKICGEGRYEEEGERVSEFYCLFEGLARACPPYNAEVQFITCENSEITIFVKEKDKKEGI